MFSPEFVFNRVGINILCFNINLYNQFRLWFYPRVPVITIKYNIKTHNESH